MTRKFVIECDGHNCTETTDKSTDETRWLAYTHPDEDTRHYCPSCANLGIGFLAAHRSRGALWDVVHQSPGEEFEAASIHPGREAKHNHSLHAAVLDQPAASKYINHDPRSEETAIHYHLNDHLGVTILGDHKNHPRAIIEPGEHSTTIEVRESTAGQSVTGRLLVESSITVGHAPEEENNA